MQGVIVIVTRVYMDRQMYKELCVCVCVCVCGGVVGGVMLFDQVLKDSHHLPYTVRLVSNNNRSKFGSSLHPTYHFRPSERRGIMLLLCSLQR